MYVRIKVFPNSKKEVFQIEENRLKIFVREDALNNQANKKVCKLIAHHFKVEISKVQIILGHKHQNKTIWILD